MTVKRNCPLFTNICKLKTKVGKTAVDKIGYGVLESFLTSLYISRGNIARIPKTFGNIIVANQIYLQNLVNFVSWSSFIFF